MAERRTPPLHDLEATRKQIPISDTIENLDFSEMNLNQSVEPEQRLGWAKSEKDRSTPKHKQRVPKIVKKVSFLDQVAKNIFPASPDLPSRRKQANHNQYNLPGCHRTTNVLRLRGFGYNRRMWKSRKKQKIWQKEFIDSTNRQCDRERITQKLHKGRLKVISCEGEDNISRYGSMSSIRHRGASRRSDADARSKKSSKSRVVIDLGIKSNSKANSQFENSLIGRDISSGVKRSCSGRKGPGKVGKRRKSLSIQGRGDWADSDGFNDYDFKRVLEQKEEKVRRRKRGDSDGMFELSESRFAKTFQGEMRRPPKSVKKVMEVQSDLMSDDGRVNNFEMDSFVFERSKQKVFEQGLRGSYFSRDKQNERKARNDQLTEHFRETFYKLKSKKQSEELQQKSGSKPAVRDTSTENITSHRKNTLNTTSRNHLLNFKKSIAKFDDIFQIEEALKTYKKMEDNHEIEAAFQKEMQLRKRSLSRKMARSQMRSSMNNSEGRRSISQIDSELDENIKEKNFAHKKLDKLYKRYYQNTMRGHKTQRKEDQSCSSPQ
jgi:hypothetical protein